MSFTFNWPRFSDQFHFDAIQMLNNALNKGSKPPIIADKIEVVELEMGTQPPELEIRDIGDLTVDQFRGIFRLTYNGDAHLVLKTKVQANPLNHKQPDIHLMTGSKGMLAAQQPLVVPMLLRLSHFRLSSYVVLVVSKQKGITLVFKTDPLQHVDINSTFDSIAVIQNFIQREIEGQLRQMFREDLPGIIHRLSQQWVKSKVEAPYLEKRPIAPLTRRNLEIRSARDASSVQPRTITEPPNTHPHPYHVHPSQPPHSIASLKRPRSASGMSQRSLGRRSSASTSVLKPKSPLNPSVSNTMPPEPVTFPDLENFDPTYGLRPEGLPTKSLFRGFSSLFTPNKGLADLAEEQSQYGSDDIDEDDEDDDEDEDDIASFDIVNWNYTIPEDSVATPPSSVAFDDLSHPSQEYETIPAVGGGTITRPRVFHAQSLIQTPHSSSSSSTHPTYAAFGYAGPRSYFPDSATLAPAHRSTESQTSSMYRQEQYYVPEKVPRTAPPAMVGAGRQTSFDSLEAQPSQSPLYVTKHPPVLNGHVYPDRRYEEAARQNSYYSSRFEEDSASNFLLPQPPPSRRQRSVSISSATTNMTAISNNSINPLDSAFISSSPSATNGVMTLGGSNSTAVGAAQQNQPFANHAKIVLRPSLTKSIHQLSTLSHSNHTLSPYTRSVEHFTVRSVPPRAGAAGLGGAAPGAYGGHVGPGERQPVKARRKRIFRLGGSEGGNASAAVASGSGSTSQSSAAIKDPPNDEVFPSFSQRLGPGLGIPSSESKKRSATIRGREFSASDMDRYFRNSPSHDEPRSVSHSGLGPGNAAAGSRLPGTVAASSASTSLPAAPSESTSISESMSTSTSTVVGVASPLSSISSYARPLHPAQQLHHRHSRHHLHLHQ